LQCRAGCGACCIAPSIKQAIPGMPEGKPAGVACVNLHPDTGLCQIWGTPEYPAFCRAYQPCLEFCGNTREQALQRLNVLENLTSNKSNL